jgi:hypothetical protein
LNRRIVLLNLALVALAGALVWILRANWLEAQARERAVLQRKATPKPVLAPPTPPAVKAAAPAEYIDVANKMLFSKDRNPTVVVEPPKPAPEPVMPALPNYHGQMAIGEPVILLSPANGAQRSYQAGDQVGDFKLVSFNQENVAFEWKGKSIERKLEELRPKQTLAQAAAAPTPAAASTPVRPVASLDRPNAVPAAAASPAASSVATSAAGKAVTSLSGSSTTNAANANNANSDTDTSGDATFGPVQPGGTRACVDSDNSPAGTIHSGYRKVQFLSLFGPSCSWEQVK